jgi:hypothetical protein
LRASHKNTIVSMRVAQKVRLVAKLRCYSQHVRDRLAQVDTEQGEITQTYPNPRIVTVRFPSTAPERRDFVMDIFITDLEPLFEETLKGGAEITLTAEDSLRV